VFFVKYHFIGGEPAPKKPLVQGMRSIGQNTAAISGSTLFFPVKKILCVRNLFLTIKLARNSKYFYFRFK
jgi:ethanolamine utilization protein EutA (predicted chaperonin)